MKRKNMEKVNVLAFVDNFDNTKGTLLVAKDESIGTKELEEVISNNLKTMFPSDFYDEEEVNSAICCLSDGISADIGDYEFFYEEIIMI